MAKFHDKNVVVDCITTIIDYNDFLKMPSVMTKTCISMLVYCPLTSLFFIVVQKDFYFIDS